jgi:hypothetical protein
MRQWVIGFAVLLGWAFFPAVADASEPGATCSGETAEPTTIEAVNRDYERWSGHCVRISGISFNHRLFTDRAATLGPSDGRDENARGSVFINGPQDIVPSRRPMHVELVGAIGSCADANAAVAAQQAADPDSIVMVSGHCHTSMENFIVPVAAQILSNSPILRLTEAEVSAQRRPLVEVPPAMIDDGHLAVAGKLVAAMVAGDAESYAHLVDPLIANSGWSEGSQKSSMRRLREATAEFDDIRPLRRRFAAIQPIESRQRRIFTDRTELEDTGGGHTVPSSILACWCTDDDCAGRWPIAAHDADNDAARPYLCVETSDYVMFGGDDTIQAEVPRRSSGFAEPVALATP